MRYLAALVLLYGVAVGQNSVIENHGQMDHVTIIHPHVDDNQPITTPGAITLQGGSPGSITIAVPDRNGGSVIVICEPVLLNGIWTPKVKNCVFQNGGTLDEVINTMTEVRESNEHYWRTAADHNLALAVRSLSLGKRANANALRCTTALQRSADALKRVGKEPTK